MKFTGGIGGTIIIVILCIAFCYTAHLLSENWMIMCEHWSDYKEHCRKPYPEMAYRAMGSYARLFLVFLFQKITASMFS